MFISPLKHHFPLLFALPLAFLGSACSCDRQPTEKPASHGTEAAQSPEKPAPPEARAPAARPTKIHKRVGPTLIIQQGKSIGPIYFGATTQTIERLMQAPCELKTETSCIYVAQAVEFTLNDGVMVRAKAHLRNRPVPGSEEVFGLFNGGMPPKLALGLHRHIVLQEFGKPRRAEEIPLTGATGLVSRDYYDGLILEYDKIENGNTVLAAFEVVPSDKSVAAGASTKSPTTQSPSTQSPSTQSPSTQSPSTQSPSGSK